jgi:hypothetical protein
LKRFATLPAIESLPFLENPMTTNRLHTVTQQARRAAAVLGLGITVLLTACGGGDEAADLAQIQKPEITRYHKLSAQTGDGGSTMQVTVRSEGLIAQVNLVSDNTERGQTVVALPFKADGNSLTVQLPSSALAGGWHLVVTDDAGQTSAAAGLNPAQ